MKLFVIPAIAIALFVSGCAGCSRSGRRKAMHAAPAATPVKDSVQKIAGDKTVVKMEKINGVYQIPVLVNGVPMSFIFDTGASTISISETEAVFLYKQGKLTAEDIKGSGSFTDANGDISDGTVVSLKSVQIGDRVLTDIEASVVHNLHAPLLFGQSALEKFGTISIDNNRREITFQ